MTNVNFNAAAKGQRSGIVRFSTTADAPALTAYYTQNRHQHVEALDEAEIRSGSANGRYMLILDQDGSIVASSGAYDYHDQKGHEAGWIEIGSTRARLEGFNLYPFLIASQVVHEFLTRPPRDFVFATIYSDNTAVVNLLEKKVGWQPFMPDEDLLEASGERDNHVQGKIVWLKADSSSLPHQARLALDFIDKAENGGLENRKTGERLTLDTSSLELATSLKPVLEAIARGPFAQAVEQNAALPFAKVRELLNRFFQSQAFIIRPEGLSF